MKNYKVFVTKGEYGISYSYNTLVAYYDKDTKENKVCEKKGYITKDIAVLMLKNGATLRTYDFDAKEDAVKQAEFNKRVKEILFKEF